MQELFVTCIYMYVTIHRETDTCSFAYEFSIVVFHGRDTAAEILKLKWPKEDWSKLMNCFAKKETKKTVFPLMLLIKEMPSMCL